MDLIKSLKYPNEIFAMLKFKTIGCETIKPQYEKSQLSSHLQTCYKFLQMTSRSFAAVIQALDGELRDAVCLFYLVLRALDTVEDDMTIECNKKIRMLKEFHTYLLQENWTFMESNEKDKIVLEQFPVIASEFRSLSPMYQEVISDICARMGLGMTKYLDRAPDSLEEWDEYCHFVAGLVGIGLSRLFSASGLEGPDVGEDERLSNSMGLFLQKTNIIRDYLEDVEQGRLFWPKQVWSKYCKDLPDLKEPGNKQNALDCLNELVTNALQHVPDCILYMSRLKNQTVFNFCAIPQVMAIATLERCYNNPAVFYGVVKIRKGEAVRMMMEATSMGSVQAIFSHFCHQILGRIPVKESDTHAAIKKAIDATFTDSHTYMYVSDAKLGPIYLASILMIVAVLWQYWGNTTANTTTTL